MTFRRTSMFLVASAEHGDVLGYTRSIIPVPKHLPRYPMRIMRLHRHSAQSNKTATPSAVHEVHRHDYNYITMAFLSTPSMATVNIEQKYSMEQEEQLNQNLQTKVDRICEIIDKSARYADPRTSRLQIGTARRDLVGYLLESKIMEQEIIHWLPKAQMSLMTAALADWKETVSFLKSYHFRPNQILQLLVPCPKLLLVDCRADARRSLFDVFSWLRSRGLGEGKMHAVVSKNPAVLECSVNSLKQKHADLLEVFTKSEVNTLLVSSPIVLTASWENTRAKLVYAFDRMGVTSKDILESRLFYRSLMHIATRHQFLERAGLYTKPNKHGVSTTENASLAKVIDSSDAAFARLVAGMKQIDYETFVEIMKMEQVELEAEENEELYDSDSDELSNHTDTDEEQ